MFAATKDAGGGVQEAVFEEIGILRQFLDRLTTRRTKLTFGSWEFPKLPGYCSYRAGHHSLLFLRR